MRPFIIPLVAATAIVASGVAAHAQSNPTADQMIQALAPGAGSPLIGHTRGIRPAKPAGVAGAVTMPAATPASVSAPISAPVAAAARAPAVSSDASPSINLTVQFATGSAALTPQAVRTLDQLGRALSSPTLASYHFRIEGHTDTVGTKDANRILSQTRADAVVAYLTSKFGVDKARLEAIGRGSDALKVATPDQTPEPRNRRVQVINTGA